MNGLLTDREKKDILSIRLSSSIIVSISKVVLNNIIQFQKIQNIATSQ